MKKINEYPMQGMIHPMSYLSNGKGYMEILYPPHIRKHVENVAACWNVFCNLPREVRTQFPYNSDSMGSGYELKEVVGSSLDLKANFDLSLAHGNWLRSRAWLINNDIVIQFVHSSLTLLDLLQPIVLEYAAALENYFDIPGLATEVAEGNDMWFMRFIDYPVAQKGMDIMATPHVDQSGFTLHLFEDVQGLQCLNPQPPIGWEYMPVDDKGIMVIISNMQLQYRSQGKLKALYHRVIADGVNIAHGGRRSAVCFIALKNTPKYNKKKFGRLQEFPVGFNYNMPFEEFSKFFI